MSINFEILEIIFIDESEEIFMKTTGVVRRIDDLGRIVIPKELRRTLRIRDGESLEIFVENEMIALRKYSSMSDIKQLADNFVNTITQNTSSKILVTDRDKFISTSSNIKEKYLEKNISKYLEDKLNNREVVVEKRSHEVEFLDGIEEELAYIINPIIVNGDAIGTVILFSESDNLTDFEIKLSNIVATFLGKHIEE